MSEKSDFEKLLNQVIKNLPNNNFQNCILISLRIIPLFIITHDWNIHYKHGITYYLSLITTLPIIHKLNSQNIALFFILFLFISSIINIIIYFRFYNQIKEYNRISNPKFFKIIVQIMFWVNFVFSPYNFMFCFENYFCKPIYDEKVDYKLIKNINNDCRNTYNYIIMLVQTILIIYLFIINIIFIYLTAIPCCFTSSLIVTKLKEVKFKLAFFPFFQSLLVCDYYLPLKICVFIKGTVRIIYIFYYIFVISSDSKNFFTNFFFRNTVIFLDSMCFFSCIIEFIFLCDWENNFQILQKNKTIIIFKLSLEFLLSFVVLQIFCEKEKKIIFRIFKGNEPNYHSYELLNKIFYILYHPEKIIGNDLLYEIIEYFNHIFKKHKIENKCTKYPGIKCYCTKYTYKDFLKQTENYLRIVENLRHKCEYKEKILKFHFPILYKYIELFIKTQLFKNNINSNNDSYLLVLAFFYTMFDRNYNKGLFYLEEFSTTKLYKSSTLIQLQCSLIKLVILEDYQNYLILNPQKKNKENSDNRFHELYKLYSNICDVILIEKYLSNVLNIYIDSLKILKEKDCSLFEFIKILKNFNKSLYKMNKTLINLYFKNIITTYHLSAKLTIFYSFFYLEMPKNINKCFKKIFDIIYRCENFSTIIINIAKNKNSWKFIFKYISDNFCSKLGYTLNELKGKEVKEFNPDSLRNSYYYGIIEKIKMGNNKIIIKEFIFLNKLKHAFIINMIGIIVFDGDNLQLFFKVYPYNFQHSDNSNSIKNDHKKQNQKSNYSHNKNECFIFTNKKGKIFAISQLFEEYFCLNLLTIKKYKINFFKDILKIEDVEKKEKIKINLSQIYENIALLNFHFMQNSSNDEFTKIYKRIRKIQRKIMKNIDSKLVCFIEKREIPKNNKENKDYYFIYFTIELNNSYSSFETFFGNTINSENLLIFPTKTKIGEFVNDLSKKSKKHVYNQFGINKNKNEILIKIRQIQILSIKKLLSNYNIKIKELLDFSLKEEQEFNFYNNLVEKETNRIIASFSIPSNTSLNTKSNNSIIDSIDNIHKFFGNRVIDDPYILIKKKDFNYRLKIQIYILVVVWIILTLIFIILQIIIMILSNNHSNKIKMLTEILINSLITRNIIYTFITTLIRLQYITNGLQSEKVIDNGFNNSITFHKIKIYDVIKDFLYYFKIFERYEKYLCDYNEFEVINIFFEELDYISVKTDNLMIKHSLNSILANSHLNAYKVIESEIEPFLFNISYYTIKNRELLVESAFFQFVFDNYFCNGKYSWDEIDNLIYYHIETKTKKILIIIYLISVISGFLVCGIFTIESFIYVKYNNKIYAKYYINYNYLQFFNSLLLKKAYLIKEFISNTEIENLYKFNKEKIIISNPLEDNLLFKNNYIRINNNLPMIIKPYKINKIDFSDNIKLGIHKSNTLYKIHNNIESEEDDINFDLQINKNKIDDISNNIKKIKKKDTYKNINNSKVRKSINGIKKKEKKEKKENIEKRKISLYNSKNSTLKTLVNESNLFDPTNIFSEFKQIQNKKELAKPRQFIVYSIFFSISFTFLTAFFIINDLIIKHTLDIRIIFAYIIKNLIETVTNAQEIFNIYAITILKGETMSFNYKSHGYLNSFKELYYINDLEEHNILEEIYAKKNLADIKIKDVLKRESNNFQNIIIYFSNMENEGACEFYINYYLENKDLYEYSILNSFNYEYSELIKQCNNISYGINSKGITPASNYLLSSIITNYYEFDNDENKNENLLNRVSNEKFISMWTEIEFLYDKLIINIVISWRKDLNYAENKYSNLNYFIFALIMIFILIIFTAHTIFFPMKTLKENNIISSSEPCIFNTIMF